MLKRSFDLVCAIVGLVLAAPLIVVVAVLVKVTSPGPIFHRGIRSARYGRPFKIYKFRTMKVSMEGQGGFTTAENDPRLTKIGFFLREYKIDELPQFINVLKGEMSIVGPRPEMPEYTQRYNEREQVILSVRPGITDLSSIEFMHLEKVVGTENPDAIYFEKVWSRKNDLRMKYAEEHTFIKDLDIIWRSFVAVFRK